MAEWAKPPPPPSGRPPSPPLPVDEEAAFAPGTYVVQVPKDQIYRVPPPENARIVEEHRNNLLSRRNRRNPCLSCLQRSIVPLIIILGLIFILGIILYLVFKPKVPIFSIEHVLVQARRPTNPEFDFTMSSRNPGGNLGLAFQSDGTTALTYRNKNFSNGTTPEFSLNGDDRSEFKLVLRGSASSMPDAVNKSLKGTSNAVIPLGLSANFPVKLKLGGMAVWTTSVNMDCYVKVSKLGKEGRIVSQDCSAQMNN